MIDAETDALQGALDVVWRRGVTMRTRDGCTLVADVWHPRGAGPWPTLVVRCAYGRAVASAVTAPHPAVLARAGYLVVAQDVRGRGDSDGVFDPFVNEAADGAATVEWAASLDSSDGRVGMYGFSYQGMTQLLAASLAPRGLRAIAPAMCSSDPTEGFLWTGGAFRLGFATSWAAQLSGADGFLGSVAADRLAQRCATGRVEDWSRWDDWRAARCGPSVDVAALRVPALFTAGWYDTFAGAVWRDVHHYGGPTWFLGAPWAHMPWSPDAAVATATHLAFFDEHVAQRPSVGPPPRVRSLATGGGWRTFDEWPTTSMMTLRLASTTGAANSRWGDGALLAPDDPAADRSSPCVAVHQPAVPVPAVGGGYTEGAGTVGCRDQRAVQDRTDVLCFTGAPLADDLEVFGAAELLVASRSTAPTDDACVTLCAVLPDGTTHNLSAGVRRATGDRVVLLSPCHAVVPAGARLRVAIAPSAYPEVDVNTSAGPSTQVTIVLDPTRSMLRLPVLG
jgi:predicted acyl esterase